MKQQTDVYIKLTIETDAEKDTEQIIDEVSTEVIAGCQVFADIITAPVEVINIVEEGDLVSPVILPMNARQKKALVEVLNYLADEEQHYHSEPDTQENHIWLKREILREMLEVAPWVAPENIDVLRAILPYAECELEYRRDQGNECADTMKEWEEGYKHIQAAQFLIKYDDERKG
ncbi:MAG: hypothetical protein AAGB32_03745 [Pseudomonadota bacterium]